MPEKTITELSTAAPGLNDVVPFVPAADPTTRKATLGAMLGTALSTLRGLVPAADRLPYFTGAGTSALATLTAAARAALGLAGAADKLPYFTGAATAATTDLTAAARTLLDDATVAAMRVTLGVVSGRVWVPAFQMWPSTTAGCAPLAKVEMAGNKQNVQVLDFDGVAAESAEVAVVLPNWNGGTFTVTIYAYWASPFFTTRWLIAARSYGAFEAIDQAWGADAVATISQNGVAGNVAIIGTSAAVTPSGTPAQGELVQMRIKRDPANDDLVADARLLGARIDYTMA